MKKVSLFMIAMAVILFNAPLMTFAQCTGYQPAPYFYEVSPARNTSIYSLTTSANTCYGSNTAVWFANFRSFPESYTYDAKFNITLYESDPEGNDDERVKTYFARVQNRVITDLYLQTIHTTGAIDSVGDQTCELYLSFHSATGVCCYHQISASVLDYNICMN